MTQIKAAKLNKITREMEIVAKTEGIDVNIIRERVAEGKIVIPKNVNHKLERICGVGKGLRTKINVNIGTSPDRVNLNYELKKLDVAHKYKADAVMDLSTGGDLKFIRRSIIKKSKITVGTVPIYEVAVKTIKEKKVIVNMTIDDMLKVISEHAEDGVDFMTIHAGVTLSALERLKKEGRLVDIVSRGGSFLAEWMIVNKKENPFYERFDDILDIARKYDVTVSLGDGLRPGSIADASDRSQFQELIILGELAERAREAYVQVMIEGPGHVPINQIEANVILEKRICHDAPFYVLGPLVTDIAPGYDHITSAIGASIAGAAGADFICYVTPSEHLRLPDINDVKDGIIASKIASHVADIAKGIKGSLELDMEMSKKRKELNWKAQANLAIDPDKFINLRKSSPSKLEDVCTMCGKYCAMKGMTEYFTSKKR